MKSSHDALRAVSFSTYTVPEMLLYGKSLFLFNRAGPGKSGIERICTHSGIGYPEWPFGTNSCKAH